MVNIALRERGVLLTGWLLFSIAVNAWTVYRYIVTIDDWIQHSDVNWDRYGTAFVIAAVLSLINILALVLVWRWQRIGLYLFAVTSVIALIINLSLQTPLPAALLGLAGVVILYALMRRNWEYFT